MILRLARIVGSFVVVVVAYFAYTLIAVPFIEPPAPLHAQTESSQKDRDAAGDRPELARKELVHWFSADDWELSSPWVFETGSGKLLAQKYEILDDGRVAIHPFTIVFFPGEKSADLDQWRRRAVILQAPDGAILEFDSPFDPSRAKIGKLIGGDILGPFTIRSDQKLPGPEDDLLIRARDAKLTQKQITSPHPLDFRLGTNHGRGRDLVIELLSSEQVDEHGPGIGGLKSLEISHDVEIYLEFGDQDLLPTDSSLNSLTATASDVSKQSGEPNPPVRVTCQGPFRFDLDPYVATFNNRVDVLRLNAIGPSDTLYCELLSIHFAPTGEASQATAAATSKSPGAIPNLEPVRLEAYGNPVIVLAPSKQLEARGQELIYDMKAGKAHLTGKPEVMLRQGTNEIRAPELHFEASEAGRWGAFSAIGPGWFEGSPPDDPTQRIYARWQDAAKLTPAGSDKVLSILGQGHVELREMGHLSGPRIFLWLSEPPASGVPAGDSKALGRLVPNRLLATGGVHFDSPQLFGDVGELQVWFRQFDVPDAISSAGMPLQRSVAARPLDDVRTIIQTVAYRPPTVFGRAASPFPARGRQMPIVARRPEVPAMAPNTEVPRRFHVKGRLLQASLLVAEKRNQLLTVNVSGAVEFDEMPIAGGDEKPLKLRGEELHLDQSNPAAAEILLTGPGAHVEARGLTLDGSPIRLNRGTNLLTIAGAGRMTLPSNRNSLGGDSNSLLADRNPLSGPQNDSQPLSVLWREHMEFDGYTARFYRNVVAQLDRRRVRTEKMEVTLNSRIDFSQPPQQKDVDVEQIFCSEGVRLESETYEGPTLISVERLQLIDLTLNQRTGDIMGTGPGKLERVAFGSPEGLAGPGNIALQPQGNVQQIGARPAKPDGFNFLGVQFQRGLTGNLKRQVLVLHERVEAIYGPVSSWQERIDSTAFDRPDETSQQGLFLTCSQLAVTQKSAKPGAAGLVELLATGNTEVEGMNFSGQHFLAQADRLSYDQSKDLLIFEGDSLSPATLWRWKQIGEDRAEGRARKILYWRSTGQAQVDDAQMIDLSLISGPGRSPNATSPGENRGASRLPRQRPNGAIPSAGVLGPGAR